MFNEYAKYIPLVCWRLLRSFVYCTEYSLSRLPTVAKLCAFPQLYLDSVTTRRNREQIRVQVSQRGGSRMMEAKHMM
jgi:hypothetical protein